MRERTLDPSDPRGPHHGPTAARTGARQVSVTRIGARLACILAGVPLATCTGDQEIERPAPLYGEVPIEYPLEMWDQGVEGQTLLRVRVNDLGEVDSVEVAETSGYPVLDSAALEGAWEMRFSPGRKGGKRVPVWARVPVHFSKRPNPGGG